jgi:hypothetical protein
MFVVVGQWVGHLGVGGVRRMDHRLLVAVDGVNEELCFSVRKE